MGDSIFIVFVFESKITLKSVLKVGVYSYGKPAVLRKIFVLAFPFIIICESKNVVSNSIKLFFVFAAMFILSTIFSPVKELIILAFIELVLSQI